MLQEIKDEQEIKKTQALVEGVTSQLFPVILVFFVNDVACSPF